MTSLQTTQKRYSIPRLPFQGPVSNQPLNKPGQQFVFFYVQKNRCNRFGDLPDFALNVGNRRSDFLNTFWWYGRDGNDGSCRTLFGQNFTSLAHLFTESSFRLSFANCFAYSEIANHRLGIRIGRCVSIAVGGFANTYVGSTAWRIFGRVNLHMKSSLFGEMQVEICRNKTVESSTYLLCASDVEGRVAVGSVTLNTSSSSSFFTDVARQFPTCSRNVVNTVDRFQEYLNNYGKKKKHYNLLFKEQQQEMLITVLAKQTSGIHRAQTTWAHRLSSVCLKAPPRLGHRAQSTAREGDCRHLRHSHWPSGMYGTP